MIAACFALMARCHARQSSRNVPASAERRAVASNMMSDRQRCEQQDWAADWLTLAALWGLPTVAMLLALLLDPIWRAVVWIAMLAWMGAACVTNARRCGRTHCRYTGPFFLGMGGVVTAHIAGLLPLGSQPWLVLAILIAVGNALIWWGSERVYGTYSRPGVPTK